MRIEDNWAEARQAMLSGQLAIAEQLYIDGLLKVVVRLEAPLAILPAYRGLSDLYQYEGKQKHTLRLHREILRIYEQEFGPQHVTVALTLIELGTLCRNLGDYYLSNKFYRNGISLLFHHVKGLLQRLADDGETLEGDLAQLVEHIQAELNTHVAFGALAKCIASNLVEACVDQLTRRFRQLLEKALQSEKASDMTEPELSEVWIALRRIEHWRAEPTVEAVRANSTGACHS